MNGSRLLGWLNRNAELSGSNVALIEGATGLELSWSDFRYLARAASLDLKRRGVAPGDRVAIVGANSINWLIAFFGILGCGGIAVCLNYRQSPSELANSMQRVGAKLALVDGLDDLEVLSIKLDDFVKQFSESLPAENEDEASSLPRVAETDAAAIYFSSGTTGQAKCILHSHASLAAGGESETVHHSLSADDVFLCLPPLYHTGAKVHWFGSLMTGGSVVISSEHGGEDICSMIERYNCTVVFLIVPWAVDLIRGVDESSVSVSRERLGSLRLIHMGAQTIDRILIEKLLSVFTWVDYDTNYGLTEAGGPGCLHLGTGAPEAGRGAIGRPSPGWEAKIDSPRGVSRGELLVRGPGLMLGYVGSAFAELQSGRDSDGWLRTGDIVRRDDQGFYWLVDRLADLMVIGGESCFPGDLERIVLELSFVRDAAVCGLADARLGEAVGLRVNAPLGVEQEILGHLQARLPKYFLPKVISIGEVPRNHLGKIDRVLVRGLFDASTT